MLAVTDIILHLRNILFPLIPVLRTKLIHTLSFYLDKCASLHLPIQAAHLTCNRSICLINYIYSEVHQFLDRMERGVWPHPHAHTYCEVFVPAKLAEQLGPTGPLGMETQTPCSSSPPRVRAQETGNDLWPYTTSSVNCANAAITIRPIELEKRQRYKMIHNVTHKDCPCPPLLSELRKSKANLVW